MKSEEAKKDLEKYLTALIKKFNSRTDVYDSIVEKLKDQIPKNEIVKVWSGNKPLMFLSDIELLLISQAFYESMESTEELETINPKNYFTDNEFDSSLHYMSSENIKKDSITFHGVTRTYQKKIGYIYHIPSVTCKEISEMKENGITNYNLLAQREAIIEQVFGQEVKLPKIFPEKVNNIAEKILNGDYYPVDTITINVLKTGKDMIDFKPVLSENIGDLTLYKVEGSSNDTIDGSNRSEAADKAYKIAKEQNKTIEVTFKVDVINVSLKNSHEAIIQINNQTPLETERVKALEPSKFITIAKDINHHENEELNVVYDKFAESVNEYNKFNKIGTIQILSESLEDHYKDMLDKNNPTVYKDILDYEVEFLNEFYGANFKYLEDIKKSKETSVIFDINMPYAYIYISKIFFDLYESDYKLWRQTIKKIAKSFDFNKENKDWENLRTTGKLTPKAKKEFISYFENAIKEKDEVALATL